MSDRNNTDESKVGLLLIWFWLVYASSSPKARQNEGLFVSVKDRMFAWWLLTSTTASERLTCGVAQCRVPAACKGVYSCQTRLRLTSSRSRLTLNKTAVIIMIMLIIVKSMSLFSQ